MKEAQLNVLAEQVAALARRVDEQASLSLKTQNSVSSLAESVAAVVARQRGSDKRLHLNSFIAYVLFTLLLGGGFYGLYQSRTGPMVRERDDAVAERDTARSRVEQLTAEVGNQKNAREQAYEFYTLLRDNKGTEAIARFPEVERAPLTPTERELFAQGVAKMRSEIVDAGYLTGIDAFRKNSFERAITELRRGLAYQSEGSRAAQMRYYLGVSLHKKGQHEEAARQIELAMAGGVADAGITEARFYLASALEQLGRYADARTEYGKFASAHPKSALAAAARRKALQLSRAAVPRN